MRKAILSATIVVAALASCGKDLDGASSLGYTESEKSELRVFVEYCRGNLGLQREAYYENIWDCTDTTLRDIARHYADQDEFADVSDYEHQREVDAIIYRK